MYRRLIDLGLGLTAQAAALLVPLVFYLDANEVFHLPKGVALVVLGSVAGVLLLLRGEPIRTRGLVPAALFLASCALSLIATPLTDATLERIWEISAVVILMLVAETGVVSTRKLLGVMLAAHFFVTLYAAAQYLGMDTIQWSTFGERRVYSTAGNPDFLAAQSSIVLPVMAGIIIMRPPMGTSWILGALLLLAFPSLFYTQARGASISFLAGLFTMAWMIHRHVFHLGIRRFATWVVGAGAAVAVLLVVLPTGRAFLSRFAEFSDPLKSHGVQIRLFYWHSGWLMAQEHPLTGAGAGAFHLAGTRTQGMAQAIWDRRWPEMAEAVSPHLELYAHHD
jgi:O-antigen ligase